LLGIGKESVMALLMITATLVIPIACFGMLVEFLQTGPIVTLEKMLPRMSHLNPAEGVKRMFAMDNLVELIKSILQTSILLLIAAWVVMHSMDEIADLPLSNPLKIVEAISYLVLRVFGWTCLAFVLMTFADAAYQHHSFTKKMKMSMRDIREEIKKSEGDPMVKNTRRQLAKEWSEENATQAARDANVVVVNPTHVAVALVYKPEEQKVPLISARAEEELALAMREAAEDSKIPILRNEQLARALLAAKTEDDVVPRELFNIVAEVIIWAQSVKRKLDDDEENALGNAANDTPDATNETERQPPGEDLTRYPPPPLLGSGND
jgi:flagellar biosynthesis protein FlhB